ncbi:DNA helicase [Tanacetum coccineum]
MALTFNIREYEAMEKPVVTNTITYIGLQLSGTSATHYYLNPNIPETYHIKEQYQQLANTVPILNIDNQRHQNQEEEKHRNRFPLATLLEVNPQNYQRARFTSHATIYKISTQNKWYYERCTECKNQVIPGDPIPTCKNHRPQPTPTYSNQVNSLIKDCNELLAELSDKNPYHLPSALKELEVFPNTILPLPTLPVEHVEPEPVSPQLPKPVILTEPPSPALSRTANNQFDPQLNITNLSQESPTRLEQPEDPMKSQQEKEPADLPPLSTDMSTHIQALQSTPPQIENPTETRKGSKPSNPT